MVGDGGNRWERESASWPGVIVGGVLFGARAREEGIFRSTRRDDDSAGAYQIEVNWWSMYAVVCVMLSSPASTTAIREAGLLESRIIVLSQESQIQWEVPACYDCFLEASEIQDPIRQRPCGPRELRPPAGFRRCPRQLQPTASREQALKTSKLGLASSAPIPWRWLAFALFLYLSISEESTPFALMPRRK